MKDPFEPEWTLKSALKTIRHLEPFLSMKGYHCGLTGSVLYTGESYKDVDIILFPHSTKHTLPETEILEHIKRWLGGGAYQLLDFYGTKDGKQVYKFICADERRIDFFFLK